MSVRRAELQEIVAAVDTAAAYLGVGNVSLQGAVDLACDQLHIPADLDRRIVRRGVARRLEREGNVQRRGIG